MIARLGAVLSRFSTRWVPDPFALALLFTAVVVGVAAVRLTMTGTADITATLVGGWVDGFSSKPLLAFALQMCLVLVTGHALALSPPVQRLVRWAASLPRTAAQAAGLVSLVACGAAVVHWGLGAIVGAFAAREVARHAPARGLKLHYPLLGAAAYTGLAVWHGGLSGSAPLKVAEQGHFAESLVGVLPVQETLLSPLNFCVTGGLLVVLPLTFMAMTPRDEASFIAFEGTDSPERSAPAVIDSFPTWLQETPALGWVVGGLGTFAVAGSWAAGRLSLDLNLVNLLFLFVGIAFQGRLRGYVDAISDGARGAGAVILQFPFYFGILGVMKASGLIQWIGGGLVAIANPTTFPVIAFLSAGLVNLFVPSGGGQWAVQGELLLTAARQLHVEPGAAVMAFSYGDAWTNMLQPFWALPLLGIMGLKAQQIIGYTAVVFLLMLAVVPLALLAFA